RRGPLRSLRELRVLLLLAAIRRGVMKSPRKQRLELQEVEERELSVAIEVRLRIPRREQVLEREEIEEIEHTIAVEVGRVPRATAETEPQVVDGRFHQASRFIVARHDAKLHIGGRGEEVADAVRALLPAGGALRRPLH